MCVAGAATAIAYDFGSSDFALIHKFCEFGAA